MKSSSAELSTLAEDDEDGFSLGGGGRLDSSSVAGATGLETADPPPPSTPLPTEGAFSESLHSSSSRFSGFGLLCLRRDILCVLPSPIQRRLHTGIGHCCNDHDDDDDDDDNDDDEDEEN